MFLSCEIKLPVLIASVPRPKDGKKDSLSVCKLRYNNLAVKRYHTDMWYTRDGASNIVTLVGGEFILVPRNLRLQCRTRTLPRNILHMASPTRILKDCSMAMRPWGSGSSCW